MAAIHETAYPRLKPQFTQKDLTEVFTLLPEEIDFINQKTKLQHVVSRLGLAITLKIYQCLGRTVRINDINMSIKCHLAKQLDIALDTDLSLYKTSTRHRHNNLIRDYLNINLDRQARRKCMKETALDAAKTCENLADIINRVIEDLLCYRYELPAYQALVRLARAARTLVNQGHYRQINDALSEVQKDVIDSILEIGDKNDDQWTWHGLKSEPKAPTTRKMQVFIDYVNRLKSLREQFHIDVDFIAPKRLEHLRDEAMITDQSDMRKFGDLKRYSLVVILIYMKLTSAMDDLVQILILWIRQLENRAKEQFEKYQLAEAEKTGGLVLVLYNMLLTVNTEETPGHKIDEIETHLGGKTKDLIEICRKYLGLTGDKHFSWMLKPYRNKRNLLFNLLQNLTICSSSEDKSVENALSFIKHYRASTKEWIELSDNDSPMPELSILSEHWFKLVTGKKKSEEVTKINRHAYEIAVFYVLKGDLNCSDAYVDNAFLYDDPNKQYVSWDEFHEAIDDYCEVTTLPKDRYQFTQHLKRKLRGAASKTNQNYPNNPHLIINDGKPILKKLPAKNIYPGIDKIRQAVVAKMPVVSIVEAMIAVEQWLAISTYFKPLSGYESKITNYPARFIATALAYGAYMGPTQTERCLPQFTRKKIAWLFHHHATEQRIINAVNKLINEYNLFELPRCWGAGDSASVDGTFLDIYSQNLLAAHHIRYGRYGGVGYHHVSDKYIALFSNFISCAVHESIYLLDGIVENDSDVQVNKVHGDSWAQSEVLFGLAFLMGISVMPRIKQFKHLYYYKADPNDSYPELGDLFTEKPIDWELIMTHYYDMLRVAISIQKGKVKASTILRRLGSKSRKNKLYFAFRELGRVIRTEFLLNYIDNPEMRRSIQAATCKSEEFNEFISWVRFGGGGVMADNLRFSQRKIVKFTHLLANMLMFHTVVNQTKAVNALRKEGMDIPDEVLTGFSPYWNEHFNRFGMFTMNMDRERDNIDYDLINIR